VRPRKEQAVGIPPAQDAVAAAYRFPQNFRRNYLTEGRKNIQRGSADVECPLALLAFLGNIQLKYGITGSIGEIGVHHGNFFVGLALMARKSESLFACDVFQNQQLNVDHSGKGAIEPFLLNLATNGIVEQDVTIIQGSSSDLASDFTNSTKIKPFRIFSVDGGHTRQLTHNDLLLAALNLSPGGLIVLDDVPNMDWWGVMDGFFTTMNRVPFTIAPFFMGFNKLIFTTPGYHELYYNAIKTTVNLRDTQYNPGVETIINDFKVFYTTSLLPVDVAQRIWQEQVS
jgi:hypothetical protein